MGLIKAGKSAIGSVLADQWREFFYCDSLNSDVLMTKGVKRISAQNSANTKGEDNIISNGSIIAVNEGQCMMIVEQGAVVDFCAEAGEYIYDRSTEPSLFYGPLGDSIINTFKTIGKRFTMGGDTGKDQRVYYFNIKEISGNKYGTPGPVPFRVVDKNIGLDIDISIRCNGEYSFRIVDPMLFYKNVCGNAATQFRLSDPKNGLNDMMKSEFLTALKTAFGTLSEMGIRYSAIPLHTQELADALNQVLSEKWKETRGITVFSVGINSITAPKEDEDMIKELQRTAVFRSTDMAAASLVGAQGDAMRAAGANQGGALTGFLGLGMAQNAGGFNAKDLFAMSEQQKKAREEATSNPAPQTWICSCGQNDNAGKFCIACGKPKPQDEGWTCSCGTVNKGKFCHECGKPTPGAIYVCDKCGWKPEDPKNPPKFCPECGDPFNELDKQ